MECGNESYRSDCFCSCSNPRLVRSRLVARAKAGPARVAGRTKTVKAVTLVTALHIRRPSNVADAPATILDALQTTAPPAYTSGVMQEKSVPIVVVTTRDTYCSCGGSWSVIVTPDAVSGPLFVTVMVYVNALPFATVAVSAVLAIDRSAVVAWTIVASDEEVELAGFGSVLACATDALFTIEPVASNATLVTSRNCAVFPFATGSTALVQVIVPFSPTAGVVQVQPSGA